MTLKITIADAMLQHITEMSPGLMKPYVIIHTGDSEYKTKASFGNTPTWGDTILVSVREDDLTIQVFDMDQGMDDTIGHAFVKVRSLVGRPYTPQERVVSLRYKNMQSGELRLIVEYIQGKQHIGGVAPFQSKLMMAGNQTVLASQPPLQVQYQQSQQFNPIAQSNMQPQIMQSGYGQGGMLGSNFNSNIYQNQGSSNIQQSQQYPQAYPPGSSQMLQSQQYHQPFPQGSTLIQQQTVFNPNSIVRPPSQIIQQETNFFNPTTSIQAPNRMQSSYTGPIAHDPLMFDTYNPQTNSQKQAFLGGNISVMGATPSAINQMFGTRRMPIFKSGCPNLNWFSILDGKNKPSQCMPPRLI